MINLLRWSTRIAGLLAFVLGLAGVAGTIHMTMGGIVAAALVMLAIAALSARVRMPLAGVGLLWAAATVYVGIRQATGNGQLKIGIVHALLGIGAIGLAEVLAGAIARQRP